MFTLLSLHIAAKPTLQNLTPLKAQHYFLQVQLVHLLQSFSFPDRRYVFFCKVITPLGITKKTPVLIICA